LGLDLRHAAVLIVQVAEDDGARRAGLLARGDYFTITQLAIFLFGIHAALSDALEAVSTLLHHAAAANAHLGIAHHLELRRVPVLEQQEVDAAHLIRTV